MLSLIRQPGFVLFCFVLFCFVFFNVRLLRFCFLLSKRNLDNQSKTQFIYFDFVSFIL